MSMSVVITLFLAVCSAAVVRAHTSAYSSLARSIHRDSGTALLQPVSSSGNAAQTDALRNSTAIRPRTWLGLSEQQTWVNPELQETGLSKFFLAAKPKIKLRRPGARILPGGSKDGRVKKILEVDCFQSFPLPRGRARCPEACPYMRFDPDRMCHFKCITKAWCLNAPNMPTSFANNDTGKCELCRVPGCSKCSSPDQCQDGSCMEGFDMVHGACKPKSRHIWRVLYAVIGLAILFVLYFVVKLWRRAACNTVLLKLAQYFRSMSKLRKPDLTFYPLSTPLRSQMVSGVGALLHFRFQEFWLIWSFLVLGSCWFTSRFYGRFRVMDALASNPTHEEFIRECETFGSKDAGMVQELHDGFTLLAGVIYVATFIACILFAISQRRTYVKERDRLNSMEDYAFMVHGMPIEQARDDLEEDYLKFFREAWGDPQGACILGVSICWDFHEFEDEIMDLAIEIMHNKDAKHNADFLTKEEEELNEREKAQREMKASEISENRQRTCCGVDSDMRCLDDMLLGRPSDDSDLADDDPRSPRSQRRMESRERLRTLMTSGKVWVIFNTEAEMEDKRRQVLPAHPRSTVETHVDKDQQAWDPATVAWPNMPVTKPELRRNICKGILVVIAVIMVWMLVFCVPYMVYVLSWMTVAGQSEGGYAGVVLGLIVVPGNQLVYITCQKVADSAGFRSKDSAESFNVCLYTFAVFTNIVVDMVAVLALAHGHQQDSGVDAGAVIRNPSMQYSLYIQLCGYLFPGTLLLPYLAEPLASNVGPYYMFKWVIRSALKISRYEAEQALACPMFDLLRYGDILVNVSIVILCFFLATSSLWWVFMWLCISNSIIFIWDHYRFLRQCRETYFANGVMDRAAQYISAFPCALLAAAFMFKKYGGEEIVQSWKIEPDDSRLHFKDLDHSVWPSMAVAFFAHGLLHVALIYWFVERFVPDNEPSTIPYIECAKVWPCNWFTSNPVHCLRSAYVKNHSPPFIYHVDGKEHVHEVNEAILQYYQAPEHFEITDDSVEELKQELKGGLAQIRERTSSALRRGIQVASAPRGRVRHAATLSLHEDDDTIEH